MAATTPRQATAAAMVAIAAALLTRLPALVAPVILPVAAVIPAAEATTKSQSCRQVVSEVKVRGGKGVLNGTPFSFLQSSSKTTAAHKPGCPDPDDRNHGRTCSCAPVRDSIQPG